MDEVFTIMQIGDAELDAVYDQAIDPAIRSAGFEPRRVDRHNEGDLLKSEIVEFIERSQIIVADITNERPNCYLEIGYAMGLGKKANLILTAREDHHHSSPNFQRAGPKVHFDLEGYSILFWDRDGLEAFREDLGRLIRRRAGIVSPHAATSLAVPAPDVDPAWHLALRSEAEAGLESVGRNSYLEVAAEVRPTGSWSQKRLLDDLRDSSIHAFGWPIAVVLDGGSDGSRPRPTADGVTAQVAIGQEDGSTNAFGQDRRSYDFWKIFGDGRFYTLLSLFEDERSPGSIFFEVRITRVTEALLLLTRLYRRLGVSDTDRINVRFRHDGLAGKVLKAAQSSRMLQERSTAEDSVSTEISTSLADLELNLHAQVKAIIAPLFVVFDFLELSDPVLNEIIDEFLAGC